MDEYLRTEELSPFKREFVAGFVYALHAPAGVSQGHSLLSGNMFGLLFREARRQCCRLHMGEMRLQVGNAMFYPDAMLACGDTFQTYFETAPCLLVKVLSPGTASNGRVGKYAIYTSLPTLQTYLMVEHHERRISAYQREGDEWALHEVAGEGDIGIPCLGTRLSLSDVYDGVLGA